MQLHNLFPFEGRGEPAREEPARLQRALRGHEPPQIQHVGLPGSGLDAEHSPVRDREPGQLGLSQKRDFREAGGLFRFEKFTQCRIGRIERMPCVRHRGRQVGRGEPVEPEAGAALIPTSSRFDTSLISLQTDGEMPLLVAKCCMQYNCNIAYHPWWFDVMHLRCCSLATRSIQEES